MNKKLVIIFLAVLAFSFVSAGWFGDLFNKISGKEFTGRATSDITACTSLPCYFDGKAITNSAGTVDAPPSYISARYPYEFTLPVESDVAVVLKYKVWKRNTYETNTIYVKVDGNSIFNDSTPSNNLWETVTVNLGKLSQGIHTLEISASPASTYSMFDWFNLTVVTIAQTCNDSDYGKNYSVKGFTVDSTSSDWDYCGGNSVLEYYCDEGKLNAEWHPCESGNCSKGECIVVSGGSSSGGGSGGTSNSTTSNKTSTCLDSDKGLNYYERGVLTGLNETESGEEGSDTKVYSSDNATIRISGVWFNNLKVGSLVSWELGTLKITKIEFYAVGDSRNRVEAEIISVNEYCSNGDNLVELVCSSSSNKGYESKVYPCSTEGKVCNEGACVKSSGTQITGCKHLNNAVINDISDLKNSGKNVILKEGDKIQRNDYVVVPSDDGGTILRLSSVRNSTAGTSNDLVIFVNLEGATYNTVWASEGIGVINIKGFVYSVTLLGDSSTAPEDYIVTIDFPQTSGDDKMSFESCTATTPTELVCQDLINKVKFPADFFDGEIGYKLSYNNSGEESWWINEKREEAMVYSVSWINNFRDKNNYLSYRVAVFNKGVDLENWLKGEVEDYRVCKAETFWGSDDKENKVYVCNFDILNQEQNIDTYQHEYKEVLWSKDNVLVMITAAVGKQLTEEEVKEIASKRVEDFLNDLKDNKAEYVEWENFEIEYPLDRQIEKSLSQCQSEISPDECSANWECKTEPVVCPPHGYQTKICSDVSDCGKKKIEQRIECSPGACSGCYVPRWFGDDALLNNKCIPYGFRFTGFDDNLETISEDVDECGDENNPDNNVEFNLTVFDDESAYLLLRPNCGETIFDGMLYEENTYAMYYSEEWGGEKIMFTVKKIVKNSGRSYIEISVAEDFNAYCDIDGEVKRQKVPDYDGSWAKCQNNYECESNLCSSGECVEVKKMINDASNFKSLFVRVVCKIANLFDETDYNSCIYKYLGEEASEGSSSGGSGGTRGGNPPPMPQ